MIMEKEIKKETTQTQEAKLKKQNKFIKTSLTIANDKWQTLLIGWLITFFIAALMYIIAGIGFATVGIEAWTQAVSWTASIIFILDLALFAGWIIGFINFKTSLKNEFNQLVDAYDKLKKESEEPKQVFINTTPLANPFINASRASTKIEQQETLKNYLKESEIEVVTPEQLEVAEKSEEAFEVQFDNQCNILNKVEAMKAGKLPSQLDEVRKLCLADLKG